MAQKEKILDSLWEYVDTFHPYACDEEREIIKEISKKSRDLEASLNAEQKALLEDFNNSLSELHFSELKEAFKKGIKFATGYILEAEDNL